MKFSENSLVVDVIKISNSSFKLSVPAGDLMTAAMNGAVLRRHDLSTAAVPNVLYVPLSEAKLQSGTYSFTFASGDAFTASSADAYPEAESVSDETGGGSGGGSQLPVEIVTYTKNYNGTYECDHTYEDLLELRNSGVPCVGVYKFMASSSGSSADAASVAPITKEYDGVAYVFVTFFERKIVSATKTTTHVDRIEHKSDGSITNAWTKKYTITFDT